MYKFAIVEDNEAAAEKLAGFLERYANENDEVFEVVKFHDALDFLDGYRTVYDVVFMDIEMPGIDGMEAAHRLCRLDQKVILVFVTNMASYAVKGYEVNATDYIVKPVYYGDFELKLKRILAGYQAASEAILVVRQGGYVRLLLRKIHYIEVQGHRLMYHTEDGIVEGSGTLLETEEKLKDKGFLRCNKCYLVNQRHIIGVNGYTLMLMGGEELQISRPRKKAFMSELAEAMGKDNVL